MSFLMFSMFQSFFQYRIITEVMAPSWMIISKLLVKLVWGMCKRLVVRVRWPVEEIGRNSVIPSTIPRKMLWRMDMREGYPPEADRSKTSQSYRKSEYDIRDNALAQPVCEVIIGANLNYALRKYSSK